MLWLCVFRRNAEKKAPYVEKVENNLLTLSRSNFVRKMDKKKVIGLIIRFVIAVLGHMLNNKKLKDYGKN